jgi:hypothetical protein
MAKNSVIYISAYEWACLSKEYKLGAIKNNKLVTMVAGDYDRALAHEAALAEQVSSLQLQLRKLETIQADLTACRKVNERLREEVARLNKVAHIMVDLLGAKNVDFLSKEALYQKL